MSGKDDIFNVFLNIFNAGFFDMIAHNFFSFIKVKMSSDKNFDGRAINVVAVIGESFFPKVDGVVDVFTPAFGNVGIWCGFMV